MRIIGRVVSVGNFSTWEQIGTKVAVLQGRTAVRMNYSRDRRTVVEVFLILRVFLQKIKSRDPITRFLFVSSVLQNREICVFSNVKSLVDDIKPLISRQRLKFSSRVRGTRLSPVRQFTWLWELLSNGKNSQFVVIGWPRRLIFVNWIFCFKVFHVSVNPTFDSPLLFTVRDYNPKFNVLYAEKVRWTILISSRSGYLVPRNFLKTNCRFYM